MQYRQLRISASPVSIFFFFNDTATTEIYTLSLHDALPISITPNLPPVVALIGPTNEANYLVGSLILLSATAADPDGDRKSTRLNSSHGYISYAVFCLKKKKTIALT